MSASVSFHVDGKTWFHLCQYGTQRTPILTLNGADCSLALASHRDVPIAEQLECARALAENAAGFLAALELFAAANTDTTPAE
ncbi:hypothetical protein GCM10009665_61510 [Kitasatospora nipponensis]|uniref:Uncharacterized protein n=1 Tax=Kitasatospora nipponensis TaxID=258049 RepID=A0ABN1WW74_9ACTN